MLLKSVDLHNIRSYDKLHLEFPPGYVLLEGDVGSGKSTILMAIEFALFGLGTVRADSLLSKRERRGEVVLAFEVDGVGYEVGRTLTAKDGKVTQDPKGSYFLAGDTREPLTASDLKARVLQVLKFSGAGQPPLPEPGVPVRGVYTTGGDKIDTGGQRAGGCNTPGLWGGGLQDRRRQRRHVADADKGQEGTNSQAGLPSWRRTGRSEMPSEVTRTR